LVIHADQLEQIKRSSTAESIWFAITLALAALFVGAVLTLLSSGDMTPIRFAVYIAIAFSLALGAIVVGILWLLARSTRKLLLDSLEKRDPKTINIPWVPPPTGGFLPPSQRPD
jgi:type VI protein secretion system component VasK